MRVFTKVIFCWKCLCFNYWSCQFIFVTYETSKLAIIALHFEFQNDFYFKDTCFNVIDRIPGTLWCFRFQLFSFSRGRLCLVVQLQKINFHCFVEWLNRIFYNFAVFFPLGKIWNDQETKVFIALGDLVKYNMSYACYRVLSRHKMMYVPL